MERVYYFRSSDGTTLAYFEKGSGPPLCSLPGATHLRTDICRRIGDALSASHRVILPDQRGTGLSKLSEYNRTTLNLDRARRRFGSTAKAPWFAETQFNGPLLGRDARHVVCRGSSEPGRVDGAGRQRGDGSRVYATAGGGTAARLKLVLTSEEQKRLDALMAGAGPTPMSEQTKSEISHLRAAALFHDRKRAEELANYFDGDPVNEAAATAVLADLKERNWNVSAALRKLNAKVLIVHGLDDPMPLSVPQDIQRAVPGAKLEVIDDCGHYPWLDQPVRFSSILKRIRLAVES